MDVVCSIDIAPNIDEAYLEWFHYKTLRMNV